jgi:hypothetical protein
LEEEQLLVESSAVGRGFITRGKAERTSRQNSEGLIWGQDLRVAAFMAE